MTRAEKISTKAISIASVILCGIGLLSFSVWLYLIYQYNLWTGTRQFGSALDIVLFFYWPPAIAVLAFASLRLKPSSRVNLAVLCLSTFASLYVAEVLLRLWPSLLGTAPIPTTSVDGASEEKKKEISQLAASFGVKFDTRDRIEVLLDARSRGLDVVPAVYPSALLELQKGGALKSVIHIAGAEVLPLGGISHKRSVLCNELGDYVLYDSDEHGFHNPQGTWRVSRLDVAVVGDSFAQGFCVPPQEHFIALIRQRYAATLSLGMGGNGPLFELATLKEFLPSLKPKTVLWVYFEKNDLNELANETRSPLLLRYLSRGFRQELIAKQAQIDNALLAHVEKEERQALGRIKERKTSGQVRAAKKLAQFAKLSILRTRLGVVSSQDIRVEEVSRASQEVNMALFRAILMQAKSSVESWGGSLHFVYLPQWERYASSKLATDRKQILKMVASVEIPLIDLHSAFESHGDPLSLFPFRRSGHYNSDGNQLVADTVLKQLAR